jgi:hypothetical protein
VKVKVDRLVVRGLDQAPDPSELRPRVADELRAAVRPLDAKVLSHEIAAVVATAAARAAGGGNG